MARSECFKANSLSPKCSWEGESTYSSETAEKNLKNQTLSGINMDPFYSIKWSQWPPDIHQTQTSCMISVWTWQDTWKLQILIPELLPRENKKVFWLKMKNLTLLWHSSISLRYQMSKMHSMCLCLNQFLFPANRKTKMGVFLTGSWKNFIFSHTKGMICKTREKHICLHFSVAAG